MEITRYVWDGDVLVHAIRERAVADGDPVTEERTFCHEDESWAPLAHRDVRVHGAQREEGEWLFYINDGIGTPEALIRPDGALAGEIERSAWGKVAAPRLGETTTPLGFAGQYLDEETGLAYSRFRYYDPEAGIFLSPDPLGIDGGLLPYGFVPDPTSWIDPLGLAKTPRMRLGDNLERKRKAELRAQGYTLLPGKVGSNNGIDIVAVKRDASGTILAMRLEECKANSSKRGSSNAGKQMSEPWLKDVLGKMAKAKGCSSKTANAIEEARRAGVLEKYMIRGKQARPGGQWLVKPPRKIVD
jgi:RHS repeat-associated protein